MDAQTVTIKEEVREEESELMVPNSEIIVLKY